LAPPAPVSLHSSGIWIRSSVFVGLTVATNRQTDHATCVATGRIFTLCIAMRHKKYSERQNWRHQFRGQHEWNKARCKGVVVAVGGNCTRAKCVRARRCQSSSTEFELRSGSLLEFNVAVAYITQMISDNHCGV